jgi:hypothetical protein
MRLPEKITTRTRNREVPFEQLAMGTKAEPGKSYLSHTRVDIRRKAWSPTAAFCTVRHDYTLLVTIAVEGRHSSARVKGKAQS